MNAPRVAPSDRAAFVAVAAGLVNTAQSVLLQTYFNGEFAHLLEHADKAVLTDELAECGDGLLRYLMAELSDREDCVDLLTAIERIDSSISQLEDLKEKLSTLA